MFTADASFRVALYSAAAVPIQGIAINAAKTNMKTLFIAIPPS